MDMALEVKRHRKAAGLTQSGLAALAGIGKTSVFDIEKGKPGIRLETLLAVLMVLNMTIRLEGPFGMVPQAGTVSEDKEKGHA
ncbi:MAG: transcriptional regulator [Spartobacteria bacterium]|nr:transcriptional regulator [Spartobacteria bacterium]